MAKHNKLGKEGELIAFMVLQRDGFTILETNWRFQKAEIDIIAKKDGFLIFTEVKLEGARNLENHQTLSIKRK